MGKSRLLEEFAEWARDAGARVLVGGAVDVGEGGLPFVPIVEALRSLAEEREVQSLSAGSPADVARLVPGLGEATASEGGFAQARLFEQLLALFTRLAPLVLVIEDLQWADRSTRELFRYLDRNLRRAEVLLIGSYRTEELPPRHPLRAMVAGLHARRVTAIRLGRFNEEEHRQQMSALLGDAATPQLVEAIYRRSGGNAFFTEELVAEGGHGAAEVGLPTSLRDVLLARYHASTPAACHILRLVAIGRSVPHRLLAAAAGLDDRTLLLALREAVDRAIMVADPETGRYSFRHELMAEAIHAHLLPGERGALHAAFGAALEGELEGSDAVDARRAGELAHHWLAAGNEERALPALVAAGESALVVHAHAEAVQHLNRALTVAERLGAAAMSGEQHARLLELAAEAAEANGAFVEATELWHRGLEEVDVEREPLRAARLYVRLGETRWLAGDLPGFVAARREAARLVPADPPSRERAMVLAKLASALTLAGDLHRARALCEESVAIARTVGAADAESRALAALGTVSSLAGTPGEAIEPLERALSMSIAAGRIGEEATDRSNLAEALHLAGRLRDAIAVVSEGIERVCAAGLERTYGETMTMIAIELHYLLGDWDEAQRLANEALERRPTGVAATWFHLAYAEFSAWRGEFDGAHAALAAAVAACSTRRATGWTGPQEQAAQLALWEGRPADALAAIRDGLDALAEAPLELDDRRWLCVRGSWAAADLAQDARAEGDVAGVAAAQAALDELRDHFVRHREAVGRRRVAADPHLDIDAWLIEAERARGMAQPAPELWARIAAEWDRLEHAPDAAVARWREAEARLTAGESRQHAAVPLRQALATARQIGARPLIERVESLARRARIDIQAPPSVPSTTNHGLTPRELEVLRLVAAGRTNAEIAAELFITDKTASVHLTNIKAKLGVRSRVEAAAFAIRLGMG